MLVRRTLWHGLYAGVGYAPRVISGLRHFDEVSILSLNPPLATYSEFFLTGSWDTTHGGVVEGGIEKRAGRLRIAPELRYIHWSPHALYARPVYRIHAKPSGCPRGDNLPGRNAVR